MFSCKSIEYYIIMFPLIVSQISDVNKKHVCALIWARLTLVRYTVTSLHVRVRLCEAIHCP